MTEDPQNQPLVPDAPAAALAALRELERYRQLPGAVMPVLFFLSALFAVRGFFWAIDLFNWLGVDRLDPVLPTAYAYLAAFVIWIVTFLAIQSVLEVLRLKDVRALARSRLARLDLGLEPLAALRDAVAATDWRNRTAYDAAIGELTER